MESLNKANMDIKQHNHKLNNHRRHSLIIILIQQPINFRQKMNIDQRSNFIRSCVQDGAIVQEIFVHVEWDEVEYEFYAVELDVLMLGFEDAADY